MQRKYFLWRIHAVITGYLSLVFILLSLGMAAQPFNMVNPFIGTGGHGHTFPGACVPFGMVQVSPDTDDAGWDWSSGYHYSDSSIMGFSHTHLSGTGISDLADVLVMPYIGKIRLHPGPKDGSNPDGYRADFHHLDETAYPGYYSVRLAKNNILAELTASEQIAFHRYTFPPTDSANILVDLLHGLDRHRSWLTERVLDSEIRVINDSTLAGFRFSSGWANVQKVYFEIRFSRPMTNYGLAIHDVFRPGSTLAKGRNVKGVFTFDTRNTKTIEMQVAISNLPFSQINPWNSAPATFEQALQSARNQWERELSAVEIDAPDSVKTIFYTALYHTAIAPNRIYDEEGFSTLTTLSQWDVYRAAFALNTLIRPALATEITDALLRDYRKNGYLPVWKLWQDEVNCMIGTPSVPIAVEAMLKGLANDPDELYEAIKATLEIDNPVAPWSYFDRYGYIPNDLGEQFTVSKTLEMCYANACAALLAKQRLDKNAAASFHRRSENYLNIYDTQTGFFRGKDSHGNWTTPFDPAVTHEADFVEATPWQYLFHLQHDIPAMIKLHGGNQGFAKKLDSLFQAETGKVDVHILDITGLVGQYAHGNEPSHHVAYLYNYAGQPWKTQNLVREICSRFYSNQPDGLCGNEDCGQMSAWYIFSALGFYPVHPASGKYDLGAPLVKNARINLGQGRFFEVRTRNFSPDHKYVKSAWLNGQRLENPWITHGEISKGGVLEFEMSPEPEYSAFLKN